MTDFTIEDDIALPRSRVGGPSRFRAAAPWIRNVPADAAPPPLTHLEYRAALQRLQDLKRQGRRKEARRVLDRLKAAIAAELVATAPRAVLRRNKKRGSVLIMCR